MAAKKSAKKEVAEAAPVEVITAFKGFDKEMKCRGYQFEIGKTYHHDGEVKACISGFHSCENPLDVLNYYSLISDDGQLNKFAIIKASGSISRHGDDTKIASATLTIEAELKLPELVKSAIKWIADACTTTEPAASGNYSKLAASGYSSQLAASGYSSKLAASGNSSKLAASGNYIQLAASGNSSIAVSAAPNCTASAGKNGCIALTRWVESEKRYRVSVAYVGENGIEENVFYKLNDVGEFVKA